MVKSLKALPNYAVDWANGKNVIEEYEGEKYDLIRCRISTNAIVQINGSIKKLTEVNLKNLRKLDLEIIRNTIYARHGYTFENYSDRQYFEYTDWYIPLSTNVDNQLTPIEKENIKLLKKLELKAKDVYEDFSNED